MTVRPKSMPDVTPPAVMTEPSRTDALADGRRAEQREKVMGVPMRGRAASAQEPSLAEDERSGADRRDEVRRGGLTAKKGERLRVA